MANGEIFGQINQNKNKLQVKIYKVYVTKQFQLKHIINKGEGNEVKVNLHWQHINMDNKKERKIILQSQL